MRTYSRILQIGLVLLALLALPSLAEARRKQAADIRVTVGVPQAGSLGAGSAEQLVTVVNAGPGDAEKLQLALRLNLAAGQLVDVRFDTPGGWVSAATQDDLAVRAEKLEANGELRFTVRYRATGSGALIVQRVTFSYDDDLGGGSGTSNDPAQTPGAPPSPQQPTPAPVSGAALNVIVLSGGGFLFTGSAFTPREDVALWLNAPGGKTIALFVVDNRELVTDAEAARRKGQPQITTTAQAGSTGTIALTLRPDGLAAGSYTLVAYGTLSKVTATGAFAVK